MDDDLQTLEAELRFLRPVQPSARMEQGIAREIGSKRRARSPWMGAWWSLPLGAAAALVFALFQSSHGRVPTVSSEALPAAQFKPVSADNVLLSSRDEGYVTLANGTQARQVRQTFIDTITWKNPKTNASVKWTIPREEVQVVPVVYQ